MVYDDFVGRKFWADVRAFVAAQGVEPISDGEIEGEIWGKVRQAMAAAGKPVSDGMTPVEIAKAVTLALSSGVVNAWKLANGTVWKRADGTPWLRAA